MAFVLGTAVGPTDAAAATSIARRLGLPRRLLTIIEGEALFNDATALVLYTAAVTAATTEHFSVLGTLSSIVYAAAAGVAIGLVAGIVGRRLRDRIDDPPLEIAGSMLLAYAAYVPAQALHASGVLAAVTAGLYLGWHSSGGAFSARSRLQSAAFWRTLVFLINAALFVLVGLSLHTFSAGAGGPVGRLALTGAIVVFGVLAIRLVWMEGTGALVRLRRDHSAGAGRFGWRERLILGWSGMRGAITLAALLAVPETTRSGHALAGRDEIIYLGFAVIIVTLVGQGMTLPALVKQLDLSEHPSVAEIKRRARLELTRAVLAQLGTADEPATASQELTDGLRAQYAARMRRLELSEDHDVADEAVPDGGSERALRHELVALQRTRLDQLRRQGKIGITTMREIEHDLDLEDARL